MVGMVKVKDKNVEKSWIMSIRHQLKWINGLQYHKLQTEYATVYVNDETDKGGNVWLYHNREIVALVVT